MARCRLLIHHFFIVYNTGKLSYINTRMMPNWGSLVAALLVVVGFSSSQHLHIFLVSCFPLDLQFFKHLSALVWLLCCLKDLNWQFWHVLASFM